MDREDQSVLFFLAGANFWEKHAKNRRKHAKTGENRRKTGAFLVLIFLWEKLVGANFYAFCNYGSCAMFSLECCTDVEFVKCFTLVKFPMFQSYLRKSVNCEMFTKQLRMEDVLTIF